MRAFGSRHRDRARSGYARDLFTTDYWNPPTSTRQRGRQRVLAVILAAILAVLLAQAGW